MKEAKICGKKVSVKCKEAKKYTMVMFWGCDRDCRHEIEGLNGKKEKIELEKALKMAEDYVLFGSGVISTKIQSSSTKIQQTIQVL